MYGLVSYYLIESLFTDSILNDLNDKTDNKQLLLNSKYLLQFSQSLQRRNINIITFHLNQT